MDEKSGSLGYINTQIGCGPFTLEKIVIQHQLFEEVVDPATNTRTLALVEESVYRHYFVSWNDATGGEKKEINQQIYSAAINNSEGDPVVEF